jgi:uncharacterized MAPEG superfamily protein
MTNERKPLTDKVNGAFEAGGGLFLALNIITLLRDKAVAGVAWPAVLFFAIWGYWNLIYYRSLKQRWSLVFSASCTGLNTVWVVLLIYYSWR